jgi:hypothetical protein
VLSIVGRGEDASATGDIDISDDLTIEGGVSTISDAAGDRVIDIHSGPVDIYAVTITGGSSIDAPGGGVYVRGGDVQIANSTVTVNDSGIGEGGGIGQAGGTLVVTGSQLVDNDCFLCSGGGIANLAGSLVVVDSTISGNGRPSETTVVTGGGIYSVGPSLHVIDSTIDDNQTQSGAAAVYASNATISGTTIDGNIPSETWAAVWLLGTSSISDSVVTDSFARCGPAGLLASGNITVEQVTFSGNESWGDGGCARGGAIRVYGATSVVSISDSEFFDNDAYEGGETLWVENGAVTLSGSTYPAGTIVVQGGTLTLG